MHHAINAAKHRGKRYHGFTLLELSMVMIIIGIVIGMSMLFGMGAIENAKFTQTRQKMDRIEAALATYRQQNGNLPCPGQLGLADTDSLYGYADSHAGTCNDVVTPTPTPYTGANTGGSLNWHSVAEGAIPVQTLGLPVDYMFDAWGRYFFYAVDAKMTLPNAFKTVSPYEQCNAIKVLDNGGGDRTSSVGGAAYVLVSTGPNGHGGVTKQNTRYNGGGGTQERTNCHCAADGSAGTYEPTYVQRSMGNDFDDMVRFRERWQIPSSDDDSVIPFVGGEATFFFNTQAKLYTKQCDTLMYPAPGTTTLNLPGTINDATVSNDNVYWAFAQSGSNYVEVYKHDLNAGTLTQITGTGPVSQPAAAARAVAFSKMGEYLAIGHNDSTTIPSQPYFTILKHGSGDNFTTLATLAYPGDKPANPITSVVFHPTNNYLVALEPGNKLYIFTRSGDTFTASATPAVAGANSIAFTPDGRYLAVGYGSNVALYAVGTWGAGAPVAAGGTVNSISFSHDSLYMAVSTSSATKIYALSPTNSTLTYVPTALDTVGSTKAQFSTHANLLGLAGMPGGAVYAYSSGNNFWPLSFLPFADRPTNAAGVAMRH